MSDESLVAQYAILQKINLISAGTELVELTAGETIADGSYVGIVGDKAYPICTARIGLLIATQGFGGRRVLKCDSLDDHYVVISGSASVASVLLIKINSDGDIEVVGSNRNTPTIGSLSTHDLYDACLIYGSDGYEYVALVVKDSSGYLSSYAFQVLSTGVQACGTAEQVTCSVDSVRIKKVNDTVACITAEDVGNSTSATFLCNVNTVSSKLAHGTTIAALDHYLFVKETTDNELVFVSSNASGATNVKIYTYNLSTLEIATGDYVTTATLSSNITIVGGGQLDSGEYFSVGMNGSGVINVDLFEYDQDTDTITVGDTLTLTPEYRFKDTDGSIYQVTPAVTELFLLNDVLTLQKFASWTESGSTAMNGLHFISYKITADAIIAQVSANFGNDPNCSTNDTDLNITGFIMPINPAWAMMVIDSTDLFALPVMLCNQIGYVVTGAAAQASVDVYTKGYITSSKDRNVISWGSGLVQETESVNPWVITEADETLYHLGDTPLGGTPQFLVKSIGSKIYLTGKEIY